MNLMPRPFSGKKVFHYKATHGIPIDQAIAWLIGHGYSIDWVEFIEEARANKWYDFQTIDVIETGLADSGVLPEYREAVVARAKLYIMKTLKGAA